jgi:cardiolipin synthase
VEFPAWLDWTLAAMLAFTAIELAGIALATDAIMRNRTPQGTIAWVVSLVLLPVVAIPFYLAFGSRRFNGYVRAIRRGRSSMRSLWEQAQRAIASFAVPTGVGSDGSDSVCGSLGSLTSLPATRGNRVRLLVDGEETFEAILAGIAAARESIVVQYYILRDDRIGCRFREALVAAQRRGVAVRLLYDEIGSASLPKQYLAPLLEAGGAVSGFRTTRHGNRFQINFRNHRKCVVVDGRLAFTGGLNVGDEYLGLDPRFGQWRDTHLELEGPCVVPIQLAWCEDWHWATGEAAPLRWGPAAAAGEATVAVVASGPADELETCSLAFLHLIAAARRRLWIATPYFVPDEAIIAALQLAARRGVDVRVMVPRRSDNTLVNWSSFSYYPDMIPAGVRLYRYGPGFLHHKVLLSDEVAVVGSANVDSRSFRINFEMTVASAGGGIAEELAAMMRRDFERCHGARLADFESRPWWFRARSRAARLLGPIQ